MGGLWSHEYIEEILTFQRDGLNVINDINTETKSQGPTNEL